MAAKSRKLLDFQVLPSLQFLELRLVDSAQEKVVWVSLIVQGQVQHLFISNSIRVLFADCVFDGLAGELDLESQPSLVLLVQSSSVERERRLDGSTELTRTRCL